MSKQVSKIYFDACLFINLAKFKASRDLEDDEKREVWWTQKLLEASRKKDIGIVTSTISVAECTHVRDGLPVPSQDIQRFFDGLLCSGKGGVYLTQSTYSIIERARNLRWINGIFLGGMDSIHVASAIDRGCTELLTGDGKILRNAEKIEELGIRVCRAFQTSLLPSEYNQMDLEAQSEEGSSEEKSAG